MRAADPAGQPTLDGRTARSARTRDAVVRALLGLISEGDVRPTAGRIAERAGISLRSVYVHFDDLDDLFLEAAREQRSRVAALVRALPAGGPFETRLATFVDQRARVLEAIAGVAKATALQEPFSPALAAASRSARQKGRDEVERVFAAELDDFDPATRRQVLDSCDALAASDNWEYLRARRALEPAAAAASMTTALRLLLRPDAPTRALARVAGGEQRR